MSTPCALIILDGWALGPDPSRSAIAAAHTPFFDRLMAEEVHAELTTHGPAVGLPEGQMGNSEVGHMNIGAGRIVDQELLRIGAAIDDGAFDRSPVLEAAFDHACHGDRTLHLMGLVGTGGVHAHQDHLIDLVRAARAAGVQRIAVHAFTDGRDTDPHSGLGFVHDLEAALAAHDVRVGSVIGRYWAMDRDLRWERIARAYDLLVHGTGHAAPTASDGIQSSYDAGVTDEFIEPIAVDGAFRPIRPGDAVICFNFRTDRCRQITRALTQDDLPDHGMHTLDLHYVTMTEYDAGFRGIPAIFGERRPERPLGQVLSEAGKTQLRMAETEKYPHVTFFFNGGREEPFDGEERIVVPSPKVATYDLQPEMSAAPLTDRALDVLDDHRPDFICLNYANPDMVAHTGDFVAATAACETVDACAHRLVDRLTDLGYAVLVTSDHGNADFMRNDDGSPNTAHTRNPVPLILVNGPAGRRLREGILGDIAPTVLEIMGMDTPEEMTGQHLLA